MQNILGLPVHQNLAVLSWHCKSTITMLSEVVVVCSCLALRVFCVFSHFFADVWQLLGFNQPDLAAWEFRIDPDNLKPSLTISSNSKTAPNIFRAISRTLPGPTISG